MKIVASAPRARFPDQSERERTYPTITPAAAQGVLDAIWWHPQILWVVDRVVVLNPIRTEIVIRPKVRNQTTGKMGMDSVETLADVAYGIEAHFERTRRWDEPGTDGRPYTEGKVLGMMSRRLRQGRHQAYLGSPEFPATIRQIERFPTSHYDGTIIDLGELPCEGSRHGRERTVFHAIMRDGIIEIPRTGTKASRKGPRRRA